MILMRLYYTINAAQKSACDHSFSLCIQHINVFGKILDSAKFNVSVFVQLRSKKKSERRIEYDEE